MQMIWTRFSGDGGRKVIFINRKNDGREEAGTGHGFQGG